MSVDCGHAITFLGIFVLNFRYCVFAVTAVLIGRDSATPPPPHLDSYTRALLVRQDRRRLFVTVRKLTDMDWHNLVSG
jgi:hypothetical protein